MTNLHINLILESEQRSGNVVSLKSCIRVCSIAVPSILLSILITMVLSTVISKSKLRMLEAESQDIEPKREKAVKLIEQLKLNKSVRAELEGWHKSHINWHEQLSALRGEIPGTIQLQNLSVNHILEAAKGKARARMFSMTLSGKATGSRAEKDIHSLSRRLEKADVFAAVIEAAQVTRYGADTTESAVEGDRIFQLDCTYRPRKFE